MKLLEQEILAARILIVDDQAINVRLLERLLAEAGYTAVSSTLDPTAVCALHRQYDHDLILLDLQMPAMDGFAVMAALQTGVGSSYLPVIVLTAQPAHKLRALQAGARDFISKPFDLLEVKTRIHNMLEVRLLYRRLAEQNELLESRVRERTAELRESEARFRSLTELASDWYWEQDESGRFTKVSGPVLEMLGLRVDSLDGSTQIVEATAEASGGSDGPDGPDGPNGRQPEGDDGWNPAERAALRAAIAERRPFLDFAFSRINADGTSQQFRVSGEPMFTQGCRFVGYRGIGVETTPRAAH